MLYVEFDQQITEAQIMGVDGRLHKQILNPTSNNLQVGDLEPGWYIIRMTDGQSWYIAQWLIKNKGKHFVLPFIFSVEENVPIFLIQISTFSISSIRFRLLTLII